ncbi:MAG: hypothetical protein LBE71_01345, partial [Dysgonamonadaceae bacterium]|nr:hypothetical protein [Dysgonamonadaceae bacterium]
MNRNGVRFLLISLFSLSSTGISAQISHGGKPFFLQLTPQSVDTVTTERGISAPTSKSVATGSSFGEQGIYFFNLDSAIRKDPVEESGSLRSFCFAHKFYTCIEKKKDAALTVLPDGTKVWQIYIHSKGAYSINVLLTDF